MEGSVNITKQNGIGTISFFHPKSNSLPGALLRKLAKTITTAGEDLDTQVIVVKSEGEKAFCAGASFDELAAIHDMASGKAFFSGFAQVINAVRKCPKIIIGRIHGQAVGGGVGLAAAVDYALATTQANIKLSELAVGIGPFVVGPPIERKMGLSALTHLTLNPTDWHGADWAKANGLFHEVYPSTHALDDEIQVLFKKLIQYNPEATKALKKTWWQDTDHWDELLEARAAISGQLVLSEFTKRAINEFKRK